jgi:hypothetical protein
VEKSIPTSIGLAAPGHACAKPPSPATFRTEIRLLPADITAIEATIHRLLAGHEADRTLGPTELAQALSPEADWHRVLPLVRKAAVDLALAGRLIIYRKGKPVDPSDFKGVWRMGLPRHD